MLTATRGFVFIRARVLRSNDPLVGIEPSPRACRGGGVGDNLRHSGFATHILALAKPPIMSRGRVCDMREEKVGLDAQQMTA
jgi:hypothetical protein